MRIQISFHWDPPETLEMESYGDVEVVRSPKLGLKPDYVIDVGHVGQPASMQVNPGHRALCLTEPSGLFSFKRWMPDILSNYPLLVMGWHPEVLALPQGVLYNATSPWIKSWDPNTPKQFGISGFVSSKKSDSCPGYGLRNFILDHEYEIRIPSMVWNYRGSWRGQPHGYPAPSKDIGMDRMFHFAIENCSEEWYHTEKVLDCFMSFSVPLYWGDPMIGDCFDPEGIIFVNRKNLIDTVNSLSPELYNSKIPAMRHNRLLAESYLDETTGLVEVLLAKISNDN